MDKKPSQSETSDTKVMEMDVDCVFGKPEKVEDGRILLPVMEITQYMCDEGCCAGEEQGAACTCSDAAAHGSGTRAKARPIAYIEVDSAGARVQPIIDEQKIVLAGILLSAWSAAWIGLLFKKLLPPCD